MDTITTYILVISDGNRLHTIIVAYVTEVSWYISMKENSGKKKKHKEHKIQSIKLCIQIF